jgi:hypothetical protein
MLTNVDDKNVTSFVIIVRKSSDVPCSMIGKRLDNGSDKLYRIYCSRRIFVDQNSNISLLDTRRATLQCSNDEPIFYDETDQISFELIALLLVLRHDCDCRTIDRFLFQSFHLHTSWVFETWRWTTCIGHGIFIESTTRACTRSLLQCDANANVARFVQPFWPIGGKIYLSTRHIHALLSSYLLLQQSYMQ